MTKDWLRGLALCATVSCNIESATQADRDTPQASSSGYLGMNDFALVVDDIRVR